MKNLILILFIVFSLPVFSLPKRDNIPISSVAKIREELQEIIDVIKKESSKKKNQRDKWAKYIAKIRKNAKNREKAVADFITKSEFYITLQRNTFIKKRGGFEHTPMCIILPVIYKKKIILIGDQLCTSPNMKRLYPLKDFVEDLHKEIKRAKSVVAELEADLEKIKDELKDQEELLTETLNLLPEYENDDANKNKFLELQRLVGTYKNRIRELKKRVKHKEAKYEKEKDREELLLITNEFVNEQMEHYKLLPTEKTNTKDSPLVKRLKELGKLRKDGIITQQDYDKAKQKLLTEMK